MYIYRALAYQIGKGSLKITRKNVSRFSSAIAINDFVKLSCGSEIFYERHGNGDNTLLCIPGALGTTQSDFYYQIKNLSNDFTVVSFDPRGYGKSVKTERIFDEYFYHRDADDGAALMELLGIKKYSVLGWSDGGICGIILAANQPTAVQKLVVWGSNSYVSDSDVQLIEARRDTRQWSDRMRKPLEEMYGEKGLQELWTHWVNGFIDFKNRPEKGICIEELSNIKCPTLIVHGLKDMMCPEFHADFIHKQIVSSQLIKWPDGKHNLHMKYNKEFNKLVTDFILEKKD